MKKCTTVDAVHSKIRDPEKMNPEKLRKVLSPLKLKQDRENSRTQNDILICYWHWIHVENGERRLIDGEEQNLNSGKFTGCADKLISGDVVDELISTAINAVDSTDFFGNATGGFISAINAGNSKDCADLLMSNDAVDGLISTDIDAGTFTDFAAYYAGGLIDAINTVNLMDCDDITVSDDAADGLITIAIDAGNPMDCAEDATGGYIVAIDAGVSMNCADLSI